MLDAAPTYTVRTTCPYCGVGCGVLAMSDDAISDDATPDGAGGAVIQGDAEHPANRGRLCSKGSALGETLSLEGRLLFPEIGGRRVSWDEALDFVAGGLARIVREHGPGAVAFYLSGQLLTEDYYVANKLAKGFIGAPNVDTNSRLCMASTVAGHKRAFGADAVPQCYEDLDLADLVVLAGSNMAWCHPILHQRTQAARERRGARLVNIDPRRTATSEGADMHLAIAPGTDALLWNGLLVWLADHGGLDEAFVRDRCEGFEAALAEARRQAPDAEAVAAACGLSGGEVEAFWRLWTETPRAVTCFSQGVNQSAGGTDKVNAILNCHLAAGRIGKPGCGPLSLTGQPNAMGGREVGGLANALAAHMGFTEAERDTVRRFWRAPNLAAGEGLKAVQMFEAVARGDIKALWVMGTNPAVSLPDADRFREALGRLELFVLSENVARNDTAMAAHIRLPAAAWGEKNGTVTNSERRISRQRPFLAAPGEARPDWWMLKEVAARMGWGEAFAYSGPAEIFREHAALSGFENGGARAFDISAWAGASDDEYERMQPFQWPHAAGGRPTSRLFAEGRFFTPSGKARFVAVEAPSAAVAPCPEWPFVLNTGRTRDQWHTMTRTGKSPRLAAHAPEPFVEVHPEDGRALGLEDGGLAAVETRQGKAVLRVRLDEGQRRGSVFAPIHWSDENASLARVGALAHPITDPLSGQPDGKAAPARLSPFHAERRGLILSRARPEMERAAYWSTARISGGYVTFFAGAEPVEGWKAWADGVFGREDGGLIYEDPAQGVFRLARFAGDRLSTALFVAAGTGGGLPALAPLRQAFERRMASPGERRAFIAGARAAGADDSPVVCGCFQVTAGRIRAAMDGGALSVEDVGRLTRAGTNCGSCSPELRRLLKDGAENAAAPAAVVAGLVQAIHNHGGSY